MFLTAYAIARFLWVPLLPCWAIARGVPGRGAMWLPIAAALVATAWELSIPASANIRVDIFIVAPVLMFAEGLGGFLLAGAAIRQRARGRAAAVAIAAAICMAASAFFIVAWVVSNKHSEDQFKEHVEGSRRYFEAVFRDDANQRAALGSLEGTRWAGYYETDPPHPAFTRLAVNAAGDYFLYTQDFYERRGRTRPDPADPALLTGTPVYLGTPMNARVEIRDLGGGRLDFRLQEGAGNRVTFVKRAPPRFPRPPAAGDKVRFKGVFSGSQDDGAKYIHLAQLWLWEGEDRMWGMWLRGSFSREREQPVFATSVDVSCMGSGCETITLGGEVAETLTWRTPDALAWTEGGGRTMSLQRGELVTGTPYAWAPLTTMAENRAWLRSMHPDIVWKAP